MMTLGVMNLAGASLWASTAFSSRGPALVSASVAVGDSSGAGRSNGDLRNLMAAYIGLGLPDKTRNSLGKSKKSGEQARDEQRKGYWTGYIRYSRMQRRSTGYFWRCQCLVRSGDDKWVLYEGSQSRGHEQQNKRDRGHGAIQLDLCPMEIKGIFASQERSTHRWTGEHRWRRA